MDFKRIDRLSSSQREAMVQMMLDPVAWGEQMLHNRNGKARKFWQHQAEDLRCRDRFIIHRDGRKVGKSVCIVSDILHFAFTVKGGKGLVAAPHQGHLDTLIDELEFQISENPILQEAVAVKSSGHEAVKRKPYFEIRFVSGTMIYFRPGGDQGKAFRSLHVDRIWVDEAAWLPEQAWNALMSCLNENGRMRIYSNPNGMRNTKYFLFTENKEGKWSVFHWPSSINPNWSAEREAELAIFYGGRDTAGYQHEVMGQHGKPSYGAFNHEQFRRCQRDIKTYRQVNILGEELEDCASEAEIRSRLELMMGLVPEQGRFWIGGDLGYTNDPSEITIWLEDEEEVMRLKARFHIEHVSYPVLAEMLALIDHYFNPEGIGIDNGGNGLSVVQDLTTLDKFKGCDFESKVMGFDFGSSTTIGYSDDGKPIRKRTKEYMTQLINWALGKGKVVFPRSDLDLENEFTTHTYSLHDGKIIYSKGNDHIVDSARCAFLRREYRRLQELDGDVEIVSLTPVATNPVFQ